MSGRCRTDFALLFLSGSSAEGREMVLGPSPELDILTAWRLSSSMELKEWFSFGCEVTISEDLNLDFGLKRFFLFGRLPSGQNVEKLMSWFPVFV